jgi:hypothetical protein
MWCIRQFPPRRGLLSEIVSFSRKGVIILIFVCYLYIFSLTFGIRAQGLGVSLLHLRHLGIFSIIFFCDVSEGNPSGIFLIQIKVILVKISNYGDL